MASSSLDNASSHCRKHPTQSIAGVCALCLQARLAKLAAVDEAGHHGRNAVEESSSESHERPAKKEEAGSDQRDVGTIASLIERDLEAAGTAAGNEASHITAAGSNGTPQTDHTRGPAAPRRLSRSLSMGNPSRCWQQQLSRPQLQAGKAIHEDEEDAESCAGFGEEDGRGAGAATHAPRLLTKSKSVGAAAQQQEKRPKKSSWSMSSPFWERLRARGSTPRPAFSHLLHKTRLFNSASARYKPAACEHSPSAGPVFFKGDIAGTAAPRDHPLAAAQVDLYDCASHPVHTHHHHQGIMGHYLLCCCVSPAAALLRKLHIPYTKPRRSRSRPPVSPRSHAATTSAHDPRANSPIPAPPEYNSAAASSACSSCRTSSSSSNSSSYSSYNASCSAAAASDAPAPMHPPKPSLRQLLNVVSPWSAAAVAVAVDDSRSFRRTTATATAKLAAANAPRPTIVASRNIIHVPG